MPRRPSHAQLERLAGAAATLARAAAAALSSCGGCGRAGPGDDGACEACWTQVLEPTISADVVALGRYRAPLSDLVRSGKFAGATHALDRLGRSLGSLLDAAGVSDLPVVPVPRHPRRRARHGVDTAERLARAAAPGRVVLALARRGSARPSSRTPRAGRDEHVRDAFRATAASSVLRGRAVVLLDDVLTTGATARACREALAGVGVVVARLAVVARA